MRKNKNKFNNNQNTQENPKPQKNQETSNNWIRTQVESHPILISIFASLVATVIVSIVSNMMAFYHLNTDRLASVDKLIAENESFSAKLAEINAKLDEVSSDLEINKVTIEKSIESLESRVAKIEDAFQLVPVLNPTNQASNAIAVMYNSVRNEKFSVDLLWKDTDVIATNQNTNQEYTSSELVDQKIILPYTEGNNEIFFLGQFNQNNHWDGKCLINIYNDNILILIMEAEYEDGNLINYKQAFPYITQANTKVWTVSERKNEGEYNSGSNYNYYYTRDINKNFQTKNVKQDNMIGVDQIMSAFSKSDLEGYYYGNTANGTYNDDTGEAYLIKFASDGTIRTLYEGCFENGIFGDMTGNAWYITKNDNTDYMYYKGKFFEGKTLNDTNSIFENNLSLERIQEIIGDKTFNCELKWQGFDESF